MPKTNTENSQLISFHVPAPLLAEALELADLEGWKPAELFRLFWESGFAAHAEKSNKRLVNKGLRTKHKESRTESTLSDKEARKRAKLSRDEES